MIIKYGIFQTILQLYLNTHLLFSIEKIGFILGSYIAGQVLALFVAGILSDRFGRKTVLIIGFGISAFSIFSLTIIKSLELMLITGFITGIGEAIIITTMNTLLFDIAPSTLRGGIMGLYRTFSDIGAFLGPIFLIMLYTLFGPTIPFYISTLIALTNIIIILGIKQVRPPSES
jgi:MFS family permease